MSDMLGAGPGGGMTGWVCTVPVCTEALALTLTLGLRLGMSSALSRAPPLITQEGSCSWPCGAALPPSCIVALPTRPSALTLSPRYMWGATSPSAESWDAPR